MTQQPLSAARSRFLQRVARIERKRNPGRPSQRWQGRAGFRLTLNPGYTLRARETIPLNAQAVEPTASKHEDWRQAEAGQHGCICVEQLPAAAFPVHRLK
jgi:hypothetical protein